MVSRVTDRSDSNEPYAGTKLTMDIMTQPSARSKLSDVHKWKGQVRLVDSLLRLTSSSLDYSLWPSSRNVFWCLSIPSQLGVRPWIRLGMRLGYHTAIIRLESIFLWQNGKWRLAVSAALNEIYHPTGSNMSKTCGSTWEAIEIGLIGSFVEMINNI